MAHLPVAVGERGVDRGVDLGSVERREREHRAPAHRGFVAARVEDDRQGVGVSECAISNHGNSEAAGIPYVARFPLTGFPVSS